MIGSGSFPIFNNAFSFNVFPGKTRKNPLLRCCAVTRGNEKEQQRYSVTAVFLLSYWGNKKGEHLAMRPRLTFIDGYSD